MCSLFDYVILHNLTGEPEVADRIILSLGLGSSGHDISPPLIVAPVVPGAPLFNRPAPVASVPDIVLPFNPSPLCVGGSPGTSRGGCGGPSQTNPLTRFSRQSEQVCHQFTVPHSKQHND